MSPHVPETPSFDKPLTGPELSQVGKSVKEGLAKQPGARNVVEDMPRYVGLEK